MVQMGSMNEPRDSPIEPHATSPPGGFPSAFNKGRPYRALLLKRCPEFTREPRVRGVPKGHSLTRDKKTSSLRRL